MPVLDTGVDTVVVSEKGDPATITLSPLIRFPVADNKLPSQTELAIDITCSVNNSARVAFLLPDGSKVDAITVHFLRQLNGTVVPRALPVVVVGVRQRGSVDAVPVAVLCTASAASTAASTSQVALLTTWLGFPATVVVWCRYVLQRSRGAD